MNQSINQSCLSRSSGVTSRLKAYVNVIVNVSNEFI